MPRPDIGQFSGRMPTEPLQAARPRIGRHRVAQLRKLEVPILTRHREISKIARTWQTSTCSQAPGKFFHGRLQPARNELTQHCRADADPVMRINAIGLRHCAERLLNRVPAYHAVDGAAQGGGGGDVAQRPAVGHAADSEPAALEF